MLRAFSTAATGMSAQQKMVDTIAHNLANVNTTGYKRMQINFQDLLYLKMQHAGREMGNGTKAPSGLEIGGGVRPISTTRSFRNGELESTDGALDVAISGNGFFRVIRDGNTFYTRDGGFHRNANGDLVNASGYYLADGINIQQGAEVSIGPDGTVTTRIGETTTNAGQIQLASFPNPGGLEAVGGNLFAETDASGSEIVGTPGDEGFGEVMNGYLEKSNVQMVTELVNLITAQRAYEINSRAIKAGDDMLQQTNQLIR